MNTNNKTEPDCWREKEMRARSDENGTHIIPSKRILILSSTSETPGKRAFLLSLGKTLVTHSHRVILACRGSSNLTLAARMTGMGVLTLPDNFFNAIVRLLRFCKKNGAFHIIYCHTFTTFLTAFFLRRHAAPNAHISWKLTGRVRALFTPGFYLLQKLFRNLSFQTVSKRLVSGHPIPTGMVISGSAPYPDPTGFDRTKTIRDKLGIPSGCVVVGIDSARARKHSKQVKTFCDSIKKLYSTGITNIRGLIIIYRRDKTAALEYIKSIDAQDIIFPYDPIDDTMETFNTMDIYVGLASFNLSHSEEFLLLCYLGKVPVVKSTSLIPVVCEEIKFPVYTRLTPVHISTVLKSLVEHHEKRSTLGRNLERYARTNYSLERLYDAQNPLLAE